MHRAGSVGTLSSVLGCSEPCTSAAAHESYSVPGIEKKHVFTICFCHGCLVMCSAGRSGIFCAFSSALAPQEQRRGTRLWRETEGFSCSVNTQHPISPAEPCLLPRWHTSHHPDRYPKLTGQDRVFQLRRSTHSSYPVPRGRAPLYPGTQGRGRPAGWEAARKAPEQPVVTGLGGSKQVRYIACRQQIPRGFSPLQDAHSCADARRLCSLRRAKGSTSCSRPKQRSFT